jgi:hypothetical protein
MGDNGYINFTDLQSFIRIHIDIYKIILDIYTQ